MQTLIDSLKEYNQLLQTALEDNNSQRSEIAKLVQPVEALGENTSCQKMRLSELLIGDNLLYEEKKFVAELHESNC